MKKFIILFVALFLVACKDSSEKEVEINCTVSNGSKPGLSCKNYDDKKIKSSSKRYGGQQLGEGIAGNVEYASDYCLATTKDSIFLNCYEKTRKVYRIEKFCSSELNNESSIDGVTCADNKEKLMALVNGLKKYCDGFKAKTGGDYYLVKGNAFWLINATDETILSFGLVERTDLLGNEYARDDVNNCENIK
jgi:hypothetical protein